MSKQTMPVDYVDDSTGIRYRKNARTLCGALNYDVVLFDDADVQQNKAVVVVAILFPFLFGVTAGICKNSNYCKHYANHVTRISLLWFILSFIFKMISLGVTQLQDFSVLAVAVTGTADYINIVNVIAVVISLVRVILVCSAWAYLLHLLIGALHGESRRCRLLKNLHIWGEEK